MICTENWDGTKPSCPRASGGLDKAVVVAAADTPEANNLHAESHHSEVAAAAVAAASFACIAVVEG